MSRRRGRLTFHDVTIARDDGNFVELGSGVSPGDDLALNVSSQISEGELVKASRPPAPVVPQPQSSHGTAHERGGHP